MSTIVDVEYVTEWERGYEIEMPAKYDTATGEVVEIASREAIVVDEDGDLYEVQELHKEYIRLADGSELVVEFDDDKDGYYVI